MCTSMRCNSVETYKTEQTELTGLGSRICAGAKIVIHGCISPMLLAEREVPSPMAKANNNKGGEFREEGGQKHRYQCKHYWYR